VPGIRPGTAQRVRDGETDRQTDRQTQTDGSEPTREGGIIRLCTTARSYMYYVMACLVLSIFTVARSTVGQDVVKLDQSEAGQQQTKASRDTQQQQQRKTRARRQTSGCTG